MVNLFRCTDFYDNATFGKPGPYKPQENDDRTKLQLHSWLKLEKSHGLVYSSPTEDDRIAKIRFQRTCEIIPVTYHQIRSKTIDVACILEDDDEIYLRALFQLTYVLVSFHYSFLSIDAYKNVVRYILETVSDPSPEILVREGAFISMAESITRCIDGGSCKQGELAPLFHQVFKLARAPNESSKRMAPFGALTVLSHQSETVIDDDNSLSSSSSSPLSLLSIIDFPTEHFEIEVKNTTDLLHHSEVKPLVAGMKMCELVNVRHWILKGLNILELNSKKFTETTLNDFNHALSEIRQLLPLPELQQAAGCDPSSSKFKWILLILKQMISQFKNHTFVADLEFTCSEYIMTKTTEEDVKLSENLPNSIENCDLELLFSHVLSKYMIQHSKLMKNQILSILPTLKARDCDGGKHAHLDAESYDLLLYMVNHVSQTKKDFKRRLKEIYGKIDFCRMVYERSEVYPMLTILSDKINELVMNLASDFRFCRGYTDCLKPEIARGFKMLTKELDLSILESN